LILQHSMLAMKFSRTNKIWKSLFAKFSCWCSSFMKWCLQGFSHVLYVGWACPRNLILLVEKGYAFSLLKIGIWAPTFYCQAKSFHSNSAEEIMDILDCYLNYIVQQSQFLFSAWLSGSLYDYSVCFSRMVCSLWLFWAMLSLIWFLQFGYRHTEFLDAKYFPFP
jgi:hypothetical protein